MRKMTIDVMETLKYTRKINLEVPDEITEGQLERLFANMEKDEFLEDAVYVLKNAGIQVGKFDDDISSPEAGEVEIIDVNEIEESA